MTYVLIALVILLLLIRHQLKPRPLKRNLFTIPVLLLIYSIYLAWNAHVGGGEAISLAIGFGLGGLIGLIQGKMVSVYQKNDFWWVAGSWLTLGIWLLSIPVRYLVKYGFVEVFHVPTVLTGSNAYVPFLFSLAGILIGKVTTLSFRYPDQMIAAANNEFRGARRAARKARREERRKDW